MTIRIFLNTIYFSRSHLVGHFSSSLDLALSMAVLTHGLLWLCVVAVSANNATTDLVHTFLNLETWTFRANWSFEQPLAAALVRPRLTCPHQALSTVYTSHPGTPPQSELLSADQLTQTRAFPCVADTDDHPTPCRIQVVWHLACVLPCDLYCPSTTLLNASWALACNRQGFCRLQLRSPDVLAWALVFPPTGTTVPTAMAAVAAATPLLPDAAGEWVGSAVIAVMFGTLVWAACRRAPPSPPRPQPRPRPVLLAPYPPRKTEY